ncbi:VF530 family protein [Reichenbachiella agarivorans]|uniref:VF530 family protein n=1 Tax=Reichenbachiella agarivorans TaxID=2979464 RepID=A0ABY6CJG2_9BACT|nr:VF530 family protein [Reichenbachiella agarivorans]UXP30612.1 VF530 family protein [Reichenbachiella agarivorans]
MEDNNKKEVPTDQVNNPLHGVKLADMLTELIEMYGWTELGKHIRINCFNNNPTYKSSLAFLRKTPWAREKVEQLYLRSLKGKIEHITHRLKKN